MTQTSIRLIAGPSTRARLAVVLLATFGALSAIPVSALAKAPDKTVATQMKAIVRATEGLELKPYYIEGRNNEPSIGYGFNVRQQTLNRGHAGTLALLLDAGIPRDQADKLMDTNRSVSSTARITQSQAERLLDVLAAEQASWVKGRLGRSARVTPDHRQAALAWMGYTGGAFQKETRDLFPSVISGDHHKALANADYYVRVKGRDILNPNVALFKAAYASQDGYALVVNRPEQVRAKTKHQPEFAHTLLPATDLPIHQPGEMVVKVASPTIAITARRAVQVTSPVDTQDNKAASRFDALLNATTPNTKGDRSSFDRLQDAANRPKPKP